MKNTITAVLLFVSLLSFSQSSSWCGTVPAETFLKAYAAKDRSNIEAALSSRAGIQWIPVYYHIITKNDLSGGANLKAVFDSHCELNEVYNAFGIGFFIKGIDTVADTDLWEYQTDLYQGAFSDHNKTNCCNVYVNGNLPGLCGFATFPLTGRKGGGIFLNKGCVGAGTTTYPHEMGHYLGLLHTFDSSFGIELVNGTNCKNAGDLFCDTPADFIDFRTTCPYEGDETDPNNDLYRDVIDETLYMSYFNDNCVNKFSTMQKAEMVGVINNERQALINQTLPDLDPLPQVELITPLDGATNVNSQNASFKWHSVPNTAYYYFHLQSSTSSVVIADVITTDTFFIATNLATAKKYKYIVKAISLGNTCGTEPVYQVVQTSSLKANFTITAPECSSESNGSIVIQASGGTPPYSYNWFDGSGSDIVFGIGAGNYEVTVIDNNGNEAVSIVHVNAPAPVSVSFNTAGGSLTAVAAGGTSPYTYQWSNGVTNAINTDAKFGEYQITVTDNKGCSISQQIIFSAIGDKEQSKISMKVFPNPSNGAATLNVQLEFEERTESVISLMNISGQIMQQFTKDFAEGSHTVLLGTNELPSGIYVVKCQSKDAVMTERISVIR